MKTSLAGWLSLAISRSDVSVTFYTILSIAQLTSMTLEPMIVPPKRLSIFLVESPFMDGG